MRLDPHQNRPAKQGFEKHCPAAGAGLRCAVAVQLTILGSGSSGNCSYLETGETRLLVDAGFSLRQIRERLASISRVPENLTGILVTHEHIDHVAGLEMLTRKLGIPVYCNRLTHEEIQLEQNFKFEARIFATGSSFEVGDILVDTFSIPHDAQDPVGFLVRTPTANVGFLTDLGHATNLVLERIRPAHALLLESNHDVKMLQDCPRRPWSLKQRILGRHGHLSNEAAAQAAQEIMSAGLRHLYLGHLSSECNRPEIAMRVMTERLEKIGAAHVQTLLACQQAPCPTLSL